MMMMMMTMMMMDRREEGAVINAGGFLMKRTNEAEKTRDDKIITVVSIHRVWKEGQRYGQMAEQER